MTANATQVGGTHYKTGYEHWDWVEDVGMGYLLGCATKYVSRGRKKNGLQDFEKAVHYVDKFLEVARANTEREWISDTPEELVNTTKATQRFAVENGLTPLEYEFCLLLALCQFEDDILTARSIVLALVEHARAEDAEIPVPKPVPLTDSNKHADRAQQCD